MHKDIFYVPIQVVAPNFYSDNLPYRVNSVPNTHRYIALDLLEKLHANFHLVITCFQESTLNGKISKMLKERCAEALPIFSVEKMLEHYIQNYYGIPVMISATKFDDYAVAWIKQQREEYKIDIMGIETTYSHTWSQETIDIIDACCKSQEQVPKGNLNVAAR